LDVSSLHGVRPTTLEAGRFHERLGEHGDRNAEGRARNRAGKDRAPQAKPLTREGFWARLATVPEPVWRLVGLGLGFLLLGIGFLATIPGQPPVQADLGRALGQITAVEIEYDRGRYGGSKLPEAATFELEGSRRRYYLVAPGPFEKVADELVYAEASIFEPLVSVAYETAESGGTHQVFELTVGETRLVEYTEVAELRRAENRLLPRFGLISLAAGVFLLTRAYKRRKEGPVEWRPKPSFVRARRTYSRLRLHRVFGPVERWFG
jgi:hypothetical protein